MSNVIPAVLHNGMFAFQVGKWVVLKMVILSMHSFKNALKIKNVYVFKNTSKDMNDVFPLFSI